MERSASDLSPEVAGAAGASSWAARIDGRAGTSLGAFGVRLTM